MNAAESKDYEKNINDDDDELITDQFLRDPKDVMSYYQTNMLCSAFTDIKKLLLTEAELFVESKVKDLYEKIDENLRKEECHTVEDINMQFRKGKTNYRAKKMLETQQPVSVQFFMNAILHDKGYSQQENNCDD